MASITLLVLATVTATMLVAAEKPDLTGRVVNPDGRPVPDASIFIYTAAPRVGSGYI